MRYFRFLIRLNPLVIQLKKHAWRSATALLLAFLLINACTTRGVKLDKDSGDARRISYAQASAPFAAMSELAYDRDPSDSEVLKQQSDLKKFLEAQGWAQVTSADCRPTTQAQELGLCYDVWHNSKLQPDVVAIAIRGTEFSDIQDWKSNLWWVTRFFWCEANQYRRAPSEDEIGRIIKKYSQVGNGKAEIITTGHSLGGGLAQCIFYAFPDKVAQCYAFHPSPVTAFYDSHGRTDAADARTSYTEMLPLAAFPSHRILRLYEKGEILAFARGTMRMLYPVDEKILEVRFNFSDERDEANGKRRGRTSIEEHGITSFARKLSIVAETKPKTTPPIPLEPWWRGASQQEIPEQAPNK